MFDMKWITNTPIFRRLFIAFAMAAIVPGIIISVLGSTYINSLSMRGQAEQTSNEAMQLASSQLANLQLMNADLTSLQATTYAANGHAIGDMAQQFSNQILSLQDKFSKMSAYYQKNYDILTSSNMAAVQSVLVSDDPTNKIAHDQQEVLDKILGPGKEWNTYLAAQNAEVQALKAKAPVKQTHRLLVDADSKFTPLLASWQRLTDITQQFSNQITLVGPSQTTPVLLATIFAILGTVLVVVTIGYVVNLTITRPLRQLATLTRRIAKGETSARAHLTSRDEINMVADSMNKMLDNIVRLIQETQSQRDALQAQVEKLVSEVSGVGEGDLRVQAEVTADALGVLADSFNYMVEELGSLVVRVKSVAHEVENSTAAIFDRLTQLVETGDIQLNQINEASVEVEHMADSSRQVADRAQVLFGVARDARQSAQGGRGAVQQAVEGMGRIHENVQATAGKVQTLGERSREINNIVEVISGIAHQTNRLALDAAIQAAMAGENGKGFGAVAADIRRLAERAKDQASMIAKIVRSVREDIGAAAVSMQDTERETSAGAKLTQEAGVALEDIFSAVEHQAKEIETINQMAIRQLQSTSAVEHIMRGISETTQQSTMSTRDASKNMERLARLVEQLRASVEAFKLRESQSYYVPSSNTNVIPLEEQDNQLTVSGVFRTVTSTALPSGMGVQNALPPARSAPSDPFSLFPLVPNQQNGGWNTPWQPGQQSGNFGWDTPTPAQPSQEWYGQPYNEPGGNGNGNSNYNR